ncbi:MAG: 2-oxoglutarate dehydrogenase complex dihydrolipoyllysine-residue succinyltransferase [Alphaproteobacteria bacterium]
MSTQIIVPAMGESVKEATVAKWLKQVGDAIKADEPLVELETDKVTLEVNAPSAGVMSAINAKEGSNVAVGAILGMIDESAAAAPSAKAAAAAPVAAKATATSEPPPFLMPSARKIAEEKGLNPYQIQGSGLNGRVTKGDVLEQKSAPAAAPAAMAPPVAAPTAAAAASPQPVVPRAQGDREERVRMTRLRQRIAERLKAAQNTAAMLTTFNEIDMSNVIALRNLHKENFEKKHGVKLGFMSFFVKACIVALREIPAVNAEIDGDDLVYKNYYDIGVAVGTPQGLVVPVVRDADQLSFAATEKTIGELGKKARDGKLSMPELTGGTFTITNGGVYGSLMSTPILNPPQSGILGMHATKERAVVINGKVEARPMMYVALSYDHRVIDGREAVTFLVRVKECIENPERILLDV